MTALGSAREAGWRHRWALFAECVLVGGYVLIAALPLVTVPAALVVGVAHLRRWSAGESVGPAGFVSTFSRVIRTLWVHGVVWLAATILLVADVILVAVSPLPMARPLLVVLLGLLLFVQVVLLRLAAEPAAPRLPLRSLPSVVRLCLRDRSGSVLLAAAVVMATVTVWQMLPLGVPALGLLALAAEAIRVRQKGGGANR